MDQVLEMSATHRTAKGDTTEREQHTMVVVTRIAVESTDLDGATVTAMTDTVRLTGDDGSHGSSLLGWVRAIEGRRFRFRVHADGSTGLASPDSGVAPQVGAFLAQLPASLPRQPIAPGATWTRAMDIPLSALSATRGTATMAATFRFDSLAGRGDLAYLSVKGRLTRQSTAPKGTAPTIEMNGTVSGKLVVDRRRGWVTDAHTLVSVQSLLLGAQPLTPPVRIRLKITQWMRAQ